MRSRLRPPILWQCFRCSQLTAAALFNTEKNDSRLYKWQVISLINVGSYFFVCFHFSFFPLSSAQRLINSFHNLRIFFVLLVVDLYTFYALLLLLFFILLLHLWATHTAVMVSFVGFVRARHNYNEMPVVLNMGSLQWVVQFFFPCPSSSSSRCLHLMSSCRARFTSLSFAFFRLWLAKFSFHFFFFCFSCGLEISQLDRYRCTQMIFEFTDIHSANILRYFNNTI